MAIAPKSIFFIFFLFLVISDEVIGQDRTDIPDAREVAEFAVAEYNKKAHTHLVFVSTSLDYYYKSREDYFYNLTIYAEVHIRNVRKFAAKVGISKSGANANKMILMSFKSKW
ncbi:hypothetical protein CASFOL_013142 [Castilleja foliolosa]|uniref:Cystatin domain-containing protein n=1 Tax=Castilleja foliolosa TaxID=1961234 RepID=A0ABD3DJX3_9LAMI